MSEENKVTPASEEVMAIMDLVRQREIEAYNAGLDMAYRLAQEIVGDLPAGETLISGILNSKKK